MTTSRTFIHSVVWTMRRLLSGGRAPAKVCVTKVSPVEDEEQAWGKLTADEERLLDELERGSVPARPEAGDPVALHLPLEEISRAKDEGVPSRSTTPGTGSTKRIPSGRQRKRRESKPSQQRPARRPPPLTENGGGSLAERMRQSQPNLAAPPGSPCALPLRKSLSSRLARAGQTDLPAAPFEPTTTPRRDVSSAAEKYHRAQRRKEANREARRKRQLKAE